jgi:predicted nucleic acid-binding protein
VIVCPNTSPLIVLARLDRLALIADPPSIRITRAVLGEIHDKTDEVSRRVATWMDQGPKIVDPPASERIVDPGRALGPGERSVLGFALATGGPVLCVIDDAAARAEARRLGVHFTGTLGVILRARLEGRIESASALARQAQGAGLHLDEAVLGRALREIGEA